jgi:hypothetical protein
LPGDVGATYNTENLSADLLLDDWPPRHEAEAKSVVDHGKTPAGELGRADEPALNDMPVLNRLEGKASVPHNVTLLRLPPYTPELNPIENVWEYLRGNYLGHIVWDTYEQIVEACCAAWNAFMHDIATVISVTTRPWAKVTN